MPTTRIRTRLLVHFVVFAVLCLGAIVALSWNTHQAQSRATHLSNGLKHLQQQLFTDELLTKSFFLHDAQSIAYYRSGQSRYLDQEQRSDKAIMETISAMLADHPELSSADTSALLSIRRSQHVHGQLLKSMVEQLIERGMEDHGMEGVMRTSAHALENVGTISMLDVLSLRRAEKDYIIRQQLKYVTRVNDRIDALVMGLRKNGRDKSGDAERTEQLLLSYQEAFNQIVELDQKIGIRTHTGLFARLSSNEKEVARTLNALMASNKEQFARTKRELVAAYLYSVAGFLLLSIVFAFVLSHRIAGPIKSLAASVEHFVKSDLQPALHTTQVKARDLEIKQLAHHFTLLQRVIHGHIEELNEKVNARTLELRLEKERVQLKNTEITASLKYARGIQQSMLSSSRGIAELAPDSFLLNIPRDIVGGDFLWTHVPQIDGSNKIYFALADCTGHGVPASLLSVMCHNALNDVVKDLVDPLPSFILERVNERFTRFFGPEHMHTPSDGMSISLCVLDPQALTLTFAGSFQGIHLVTDSEVVRLKGDRIFIGGGAYTRSSKRFTDQQVQLTEEAMVYLFSDGFIDQFGGDQGRKFTSVQLKQLLTEVSRTPAMHQRERFLDVFHAWKGAHEQVDDVMVLGVRVRRDMLAEAAQRSAA